MKQSILVIADEVTLRASLARWLISAGYAVELAVRTMGGEWPSVLRTLRSPSGKRWNDTAIANRKRRCCAEIPKSRRILDVFMLTTETAMSDQDRRRIAEMYRQKS